MLIRTRRWQPSCIICVEIKTYKSLSPHMYISVIFQIQMQVVGSITWRVRYGPRCLNVASPI